jgi:hypothetical protein
MEDQRMTKKKAASAREAREMEERRLKLLSARISRAAGRINVAAIYHGDGAYETARERIRDAEARLREALHYIERNGWHVAHQEAAR